jgi:hypothetical protein
MRKVEKLTIDGKPIPEGLVLNKWFASRFNANKNVLACVVGGTGTSKSYSTIRIAELWYQFKFKKQFPDENI